MDAKITVILHHGGRFTPCNPNGKIEYIGGEFDVWEELSADYMNKFVLTGLANACRNYSDVGDCFWLIHKDLEFNGRLRPLETDNDILHLVKDALEDGNEINVYFHHHVDPSPEEVPLLMEVACPPIAEVSNEEDEEHEVDDQFVGAGEDGNVADEDGIVGGEDGNERVIQSGDEENHDASADDASAEDDASTDDDWWTDFSCMKKEVEAEYETDSYHSEDAFNNPLSSDDEEEGCVNQAFPQFNNNSEFGSVHFEIGMEFNNLAEFKSPVRDYTIFLGREIKWKKNDSTRARAICKKETCDWEIYCAKNVVRNSFQIKSFKEEHKCCREFKNKQANREWIVKKLESKLRTQPSLKCGEALDYFKQQFGLQIEHTKMWRAMKEARQLVEGSERKQYSKVFDYAHELLRSNPGSTVKINTIPSPEGPPQFQRLYICLDGCKKGFLAGCRPFIGLDGCFIKNTFGGQLLSAVGLDGNNHIFVIAYAVVDVENKDNWKWFLTLLHEDLGHYVQHGWNFMSDMQKGLIPAMQEVMPGAPHRFCAMHLWKNFIKQWKSKELRGVVWQCAKSMTVVEFNGHMEHVKQLNINAWEYLNKWPKEAWTKAYFSTVPKVDNICNNTCEVFNSKILHYRTKPILTMLEEIRCFITRSMTAHKVKLSGKIGPLCSVQYSRLQREIKFANHWTPMWCGDQMGVRYEVQMWGKKVEVNLANWTCTCNFWQLTGMPCRHAIAAITHKGGKPEDMCHDWLCMDAYNATYQHFLQLVQGPEYWAQTEYQEPIPPHKKVKRGRPKKNRRKDADEDMIIGHRLKRKLPDFICGRCGLSNHNIRTCKNVGVPIKPKGYVTPAIPIVQGEDLLAQDEQALNEAEQADDTNEVPPIPAVQEGPEEMTLSQPNLSQDSDFDFMGPSCTMDVQPAPRYKLNIRRPTQRPISPASTSNALDVYGPPESPMVFMPTPTFSRRNLGDNAPKKN